MGRNRILGLRQHQPLPGRAVRAALEILEDANGSDNMIRRLKCYGQRIRPIENIFGHGKYPIGMPGDIVMDAGAGQFGEKTVRFRDIGRIPVGDHGGDAAGVETLPNEFICLLYTSPSPRD